MFSSYFYVDALSDWRHLAVEITIKILDIYRPFLKARITHAFFLALKTLARIWSRKTSRK